MPGPTGLSAALTAARAGARVVLVDDQSEAGGSLLGSAERIDDGPALDWVQRAAAELAGFPDVLHLQRTTAFGHFDDGFVLALERRTDHLGDAAPRHLSRQRIWRIRARRVLVATGAHERPIVFADNDRPGIMLAGAARTFLHRYGVLAGRAAVVFTCDDSAYAAAVDLADAGVEVRAVVDVRPEPPAAWRAACGSRGIPVLTGEVVTATEGVERVSAALVAPLVNGVPGRSDRIECDLLLVSGGWNPAVHLFSQAGGKLRYDAALGAFLPAEPLTTTTVAGSAAGVFDLAGCLADGHRASATATEGLGFGRGGDVDLPRVAQAPERTPTAVMWRVPDTDGTARAVQFVDLQRDATVADIARAVGAGLRTVEHIKRYTTIGTAHDQGKTSGVIASGIAAEFLQRPVEALGTTTFRPPYTPVAFAALAGRDRGSLYDPERTTAVHNWHIAHGAVWEDVGQWKRPRYYPRPGEDMEAAVLRECAAVRGGVGILDGSTLGKIDVQGPDAATFLDLLYTNMISNLKVGSVRYGVMCKTDGMVLDDGTVLRLGQDRFLVYTTTGGAAGVLDWMEDWLQTEWPHLRVHVTSVTEQWATFPVVGPRSRDVVAAVTGLDTSQAAFPFMTWQDTRIGDARAAGGPGQLLRRARVRGQRRRLARHGGVGTADRSRGSRTASPPTARRRCTCCARRRPTRSSARTPTARSPPRTWEWPGRCRRRRRTSSANGRSRGRTTPAPTASSWSGCCRSDRSVLLPEGSQIVEGPILPEPPVPMLGHVTSSYRSAALDRTFALALLKAGRSRVGQTVHVAVAGDLVPVEIADPVLFDPEGARRDG